MARELREKRKQDGLRKLFRYQRWLHRKELSQVRECFEWMSTYSVWGA